MTGMNEDTISIITMVAVDVTILLGLVIYLKVTFNWESLQ